MIYTSRVLIPIDEVKPENQLQKSVNEEDTTSRAKPQPSRWRQRQNHPLFISPDPASTSEWTRPIPGSEKPASADSSINAVVAPRAIHFPETCHDIQPVPTTAVGINNKEPAQLDQSSTNSPRPLECPVIICRKTFKFKGDIQYHWTVSVAFSQIWLLISDYINRMITKDND